jgi:acetyl-CoA C-acetyltransferase
MAEAFIYDAVRTPRGRGKADGSLHEVTALNLAAQTLAAVKDRNKLDPAAGHIGRPDRDEIRIFARRC